MRDELERALRVSDMLASCYSVLRDRYSQRALILDTTILIASVWLVAMAFVDPDIAKHFTIPTLSPTTTIGLLAVATFTLSLFQLRTDWKYRAEKFDQAVKNYAASKIALRIALSRDQLDQRECERALEAYQTIGERTIPVPEGQFNKLKKRHLLKIRISKLLDKHAGTNILLIRLRLWLEDTRALF